MTEVGRIMVDNLPIRPSNRRTGTMGFLKNVGKFKAAYAEGVKQVQADKDRKATSIVETELTKVTKNWTLPIVIRTYAADEQRERRFQFEGVAFVAHGYDAAGVSADDGHLHAGRIIATGGLSVLAGKGGTRSDAKRTVAWKKV
jgi:hypothetical protein